MIRIAMWSGPRSISTALMRSFENRPDTYVSDEPFYAYYLHATGEDHPYKKETIMDGETNWNLVVENISGDIPEGKKVWYQKHMAQHNLSGTDLNWINKMHNILLIRHPKEVILSYIKKYKIKSITQLGYPQQNELFNILKDFSGNVPIIMDATDILNKPEGMLKELCYRLKIPFYKEMLSWAAGCRKSDGIWGKHWYGNVNKSTNFQRHNNNKTILPLELTEVFSECMVSYKNLYQHRMRVV